MKFLRIGFVAALALALCGPAFAADPPKPAGPPKITPAQTAQGMKEAPAVLTAAGIDCAVSEAYFMGNGDATVATKKVKTSIYEAACSGGMGYLAINRSNPWSLALLPSGVSVGFKKNFN